MVYGSTRDAISRGWKTFHSDQRHLWAPRERPLSAAYVTDGSVRRDS